MSILPLTSSHVDQVPPLNPLLGLWILDLGSHLLT